MPKMRDNASIRRFSFVAPHRCKPKCKEHTQVDEVIEAPILNTPEIVETPKVVETPPTSGIFRRAINFLFNRNKDNTDE